MSCSMPKWPKKHAKMTKKSTQVAGELFWPAAAGVYVVNLWPSWTIISGFPMASVSKLL